MLPGVSLVPAMGGLLWAVEPGGGTPPAWNEPHHRHPPTASSRSGERARHPDRTRRAAARRQRVHGMATTSPASPGPRRADFGAGQLFLADSRLAFHVLNYARRRALARAFGVTPAQANLLTFVLALGHRAHAGPGRGRRRARFDDGGGDLGRNGVMPQPGAEGRAEDGVRVGVRASRPDVWPRSAVISSPSGIAASMWWVGVVALIVAPRGVAPVGGVAAVGGSHRSGPTVSGGVPRGKPAHQRPVVGSASAAAPRMRIAASTPRLPRPGGAEVGLNCGWPSP
jgi:hypothetical protein